MGIIIRQSLKASAGSYIGVGIGIVNQLFISTKYLEPEQLAISRLLLENSLVFAAFAHLGTPFISDRFFGYFKDETAKNGGFLLFLLLYPLVGITIFSGFYFLFEKEIIAYFAPKSPELLPYHALVVPLTIFWIYILVLEAYCRNNARIAIPTFIREVYLKLANVGVIILFALGWISFDWMLYGMVASYALSVVILLVYIVHLRKFSLHFNFARLRGGLFRQMALFGLFIVIGAVGINVVLLIDRTMISHGEGLAEAAIFIIATYIASVIEIPRKAITQISIPLLANSLRENNRQHVEELYQKSSLNQLLVGGLAFLLIWANIDQIFSLLPKQDIYRQGKLVVLFIASSKLIDMAMGLNGEIITYSRYFRYATYLVISMAVLAVISNSYLIPIYGYNGAAYATALTTLVYALSKAVLVWMFFRVQPFTTSTLKALAALAVVYTLALVLPVWGVSLIEVVSSLAVRSAVMAGIFAGLVLLWRVSPDINKVVSAVWSRVRR